MVVGKAELGKKPFPPAPKKSGSEKYSIDYALEQIEKISSSAAYLDNIVSELRQNKTADGVGDIANQAKAQALADVVRWREATNQRLLDFYVKMVDDLKPKDYTDKMLAVFDNAIAGITGSMEDSAEDISDAIDAVRQIFRENFAAKPKSSAVSRLEEIALWLKSQIRSEYDDEAWNAILEAAKGQMSRNY